MSTNLISGLSSGFDWRSMIDQLIAIERRRVDLVSSKKTSQEKKLAEWQSFNTKLLALKTAASGLKSPSDFNVFKAALTTDSSSVRGSDLLAVTAASTAAVGSYTLKVHNTATAQKVSSGAFASASEALGDDFAGDILVNGSVISIEATDTLTHVRDKINQANSGAKATGVTAGLIGYGAGDYRLVLTSNDTGSAGMALLNGGARDILNRFGLTDGSRTAKNHLAGGDLTDRFTSTTVSIQSLLGLTDAQASGAGNMVINGQALGAVDLATDTLATLQGKFADAGLNASITSETDNGRTYYRLLIGGASNTYSDHNNILETLGLLRGGLSDVYGVKADIANTSGGMTIAADTLIKDIDGYSGYADTDYIRIEGVDTDGNGVSDDALVLTDATTVGDLLNRIQAVFGNVTASVTGEGKLMVLDNTTGQSSLAVKITVKNEGGGDEGTMRFDADGDLGEAATIRKRELVAGNDASLTVDGVTVTRSKNMIDDILQGVTLDLLKADPDTTITLNIGRDIDALMTKINAFVTSYNNIASYIRTQMSYNETSGQAGGVLFADGTLASVKADLTATLLRSVSGVSSDLSTLGLAGINVNREGQISIDQSKLQAYLTSRFNDVQKLFTATGTTSTGTLSYIAHGLGTKEGEYTVHIDTAATRSVSAPSDATTLTGDEVLTIVAGNQTAAVSLTSGMNMEQIVSAVNSELATIYTQILAGGERLYADAGQAATITASTTWESLYNGSGESANLADGDIITFTGVNRSGVSVSGSYRISDVSTETVQDLLSAVETAFANEVTVAIDASGKIVVTDKTPGGSSLSLSFNYDEAHDLDFGTVATSQEGGQKGRYALGITASVDSGGHLALTHNHYGSAYAFTIQQQNDLLWTGGDQSVDNGLDVAGTINGEAATGMGQTLTGNSGAANIDGLVIVYTGMAAGIDVGTVKLTFGVAELYDRALFHITDSIDGYVSFKQQSIQNHIKGYQTQMDDMEAMLARKQEQLINRFVQMELVLQQIQSQSNWLAGQISAAYNAWRKE